MRLIRSDGFISISGEVGRSCFYEARSALWKQRGRVGIARSRSGRTLPPVDHPWILRQRVRRLRFAPPSSTCDQLRTLDIWRCRPFSLLKFFGFEFVNPVPRGLFVHPAFFEIRGAAPTRMANGRRPPRLGKPARTIRVRHIPRPNRIILPDSRHVRVFV